jgi:hypothetical protein
MAESESRRLYHSRTGRRNAQRIMDQGKCILPTPTPYDHRMGEAQRAHHSARKMMGALRFAHPT